MEFKRIYRRLSDFDQGPGLAGMARFRWGRSALVFLIAISGCLALPPVAKAASIPFPLSFFSLVNTNADGTAASPDGGVSVTITGGNNGSGLGGTTDLIATAPSPVTIVFQFLYTSLDSPTFDWAGFVVNDLFTQVADTSGQSGNASFPVLAGDTFGFRVGTEDNTSEPGVFTVSDFAVVGATVPEPSTQLLMMSALAMSAAGALRRSRRRVKERRS